MTFNNRTAAIVLTISGVTAIAQTFALAESTFSLTSHERASLIQPTQAERLEAMREAVLNGRYGDRGLKSIFKNFEGEHFIDPGIPGVERNIRFLAYTKSQAKGAIRTLLYGTVVHNDTRFELLELDKPVVESYGKTDKDIFFRHHETGRLCRIEVKDVKPSSQRAEIERLKRQIDTMAQEYRKSGELQAYVNRREVIPELKEYARERGIPIYEKVSQNQFAGILNDLDRQAVWRSRMEGFGGGVETLTGLLLTIEHGGASVQDVDVLLDPEKRNLDNWLRLGHDSSLTVAGASMTISGVSSVASKVGVTSEWLGGLGVVGEWAGPVGLGLSVTADGFEEGMAIWEFNHGTISRRQFIRTSVSTGTSTGLIATGALLGTFVEPGGGTLVGAGIGALVAWPASWGAKHVIDSYYGSLDAQQKQDVERFVYQYYQVN